MKRFLLASALLMGLPSLAFAQAAGPVTGHLLDQNNLSDLASPSTALTNLGLPNTFQGNGTKLQKSTGSTTTNDCVKFDANGNTVDAGAGCAAGGITALTGDVTASGTGSVAATLKNTGTAGTYGSASSVPVTTYDAQGRETGVTPTTITPAAISALALSGGTMTGAIAATNVTSSAGFIAGSAAAYAAAGTTQGTATAMTTQNAVVSGGTANQGLQIPSAAPLNTVMDVLNITAVGINVYPPSGTATINGGTAGAAISVPPSGAVDIFCTSTTVCYGR